MDIISLPIVFDKEKIDSRFRLVTIATQRAIELSKGSNLKIQSKYKKITTNAIIETLTGKIDFLTGEEAQAALQNAEKMDYRKWVTEKKKPLADITEIEKDLKIYLIEHEREAQEDTLNVFNAMNEITDFKPLDKTEEQSDQED
ncbi:MAG: DNA-directed RNA polymerase subunit omega [Thermodesulfovibrionales bacterium]|nr:DNA-directed RNA polymerase subunit omega [Thermodesulfovibrionales bacterium]